MTIECYMNTINSFTSWSICKQQFEFCIYCKLKYEIFLTHNTDAISDLAHDVPSVVWY